MIKPTLYILSGVAGAGKSTFAKNNFTFDEHTKYVSRDEIRYEFLTENEEYFSHEPEVEQIFYWRVNNYLSLGINVVMDATHNTKKVRNRAFSNISAEHNLVGINFNVPLEVILRQNAQREGHERVPEDVIRRMFNQRQPISEDEGNYSYIINVFRSDKNE